MKTEWWAVAMVLLVTLFTSSAQILYKIGVGEIDFSNLVKLLTNYPLILGFLLYFIGAGMLILALRGGELSILYPLVALSYVWVSIMSMVFLGETMNFFKWSGVAVIILGMFFIGKGSQYGA